MNINDNSPFPTRGEQMVILESVYRGQFSEMLENIVASVTPIRLRTPSIRTDRSVEHHRRTRDARGGGGYSTSHSRTSQVPLPVGGSASTVTQNG